MKRILLTQSKIALIDGEDYEIVSQYKWCAAKNGHTFYASTRYKNTSLSMHRLIMGLKPGDKQQIDHIDHNGLNNRRCNLKICSHQQNHFNQRNTKGIYWDKIRKKWEVTLGLNGKNVFHKRFNSKIDAKHAYLKAKAKYHK